MQASRGAKAKAVERPGLTEEEIEEIREAFNLFDTDGSGEFLEEIVVFFLNVSVFRSL